MARIMGGLILGLSVYTSASPAALVAQGVNGTDQTKVGVSLVNSASFGRACTVIGNNEGASHPGACDNDPTIQAIPADKDSIQVNGTNVSWATATLNQGAIIGKTYVAQAATRKGNLPVSAIAEFRDPLVYRNDSGVSTDAIFVRSFIANDPVMDSIVNDPQLADLSLSNLPLAIGGGGSGDQATYFTTMSTSKTGFLFSLSLGYEYGQPLAVDITIGSYLSLIPGWTSETSLESQLTSLLVSDGGGDNIFALSAGFSFPDIPITLAPTEEISWFSTDIAAVSTVPIPSAVWLFGSGLLGLVGFARRKKT